MADVNVNPPVPPADSPVPETLPGEQFATAVVDGVVGLGQDIINNNYARREAKRQYERQKEFAELQFNRQKEFWQMQNEYNTPAQQRQRFNQAGMNPAGAVGQMATNSGAQGLSSVSGDAVPGNQYAQQGFLRLNGVANVLETIARIEKLGAETGLATSQMTSEALRQTFLGLGMEEKRVDILIKEWEEQGKSLEFSQMPEFFRHRNVMYDLEEQIASSNIAYTNAQTELANAQTDESKESAKKLVAETGLTLLKQETEKEIAELTEQQRYESKSRTYINRQEISYRQITDSLRARSLRLANKISASESTIKEIEAIFANIDASMYTNPDGSPNWAKYTTEVLEKIAPLLGLF